MSLNNLFKPASFSLKEYLVTNNEIKRSIFYKNKYLKIGLGIFFIIFILSIFAPWLSSYSYKEIHLDQRNLPPCKEFIFGTDDLGRDIFTRVFWGARISFAVAFLSAFFDLLIGVAYGSIAAYSKRYVDEILMRFCDLLNAIPSLLIVILFVVLIGPGFLAIVTAISFTGWVMMARIIRAEVFKLKEANFVLASKTMGASFFTIFFQHIIPNVRFVAIATLMYSIPSAIFTEATLSFLGLGIQAPMASWGVMISDSISALRFYPWRLLFPSIILTLTTFSLNMIGEGLKKHE
ncbi:MAG: ABC transporter permease [Chlamydiota bacterium]|jgi:oligopeptide transport system permease protein